MGIFSHYAMPLAARGWYVFPLKPRGKFPMISKNAGGRGFYDASLDAAQVQSWVELYPSANIGVACGVSDLYVVDCDHGLNSVEDFHAWRMRNDIPVTYTVRTGRRTAFAVQMYFTGALECNGAWELDGCRGEIRSTGGYVMAVPSIHPDSGEAYAVLTDAPLAERPAMFELAVRPTVERLAPGVPLPMLGKGDGRHPLMMSKLGMYHRNGMSESEAMGALIGLSNERFSDPISTDEIERTVESAYSKWAEVLEPPTVSLGKMELDPEKHAKDWRLDFHTFEEMDTAPLPSFLIDGFLQRDVITGLAAPVAQRKSLIAANVVHAACTGEPLFDHFKVIEKPGRVIYLCPEMGLLSFTDRLRKLGLMPYVGKTLFCRTMNSEGNLQLGDLTAEALTGALVIIDTAVRYIKGDENSSEHMRVFAESCFSLMKNGAASVLVLFHSGKGTKETSELTLENAMRGSGELGAFVSSCWATRLQDPEQPYQSASYLKNVKQRDFESKPFEVISGTDCRLHIQGEPGDNVRLSSKSVGAPGDADGNEATALQVIRDSPDLSYKKIEAKLRDMGIVRSATWVGNKRFELFGKGTKTTTTP